MQRHLERASVRTETNPMITEVSSMGFTWGRESPGDHVDVLGAVALAKPLRTLVRLLACVWTFMYISTVACLRVDVHRHWYGCLLACGRSYTLVRLLACVWTFMDIGNNKTVTDVGYCNDHKTFARPPARPDNLPHWKLVNQKPLLPQ